MGIVYSVGETDPGETPLQEKMRNATWPGPEKRLVFTPPVAVGLMVFYVLSCQCVSTLIVIRRETNSWGWPAFVFAYMTALAYVGALLVYQIGSAIS